MSPLRRISAWLQSRRERGPTLAASVVVVGLVIVLAVVALQYRATLMHAAQVRTARLSFLLAEQAARTFESVDFTLRGFEPLLAGPPSVLAQDLDPLLAKRVSELSFVQNIRIMDLHGTVLAASSTEPHGDVARHDGCVTSLVAPGSAPLAIGCGSGDVGMAGQPSIAVARRLDGPAGTPARIVVADVDPGYFSHFFRNLDLGSHAVVTLTENHGHVLLASAEPEGAEQAAPTLVPPTEQARLEQLRRASRDKITAAHVTDGYPLTVEVAIDRGDVERQWRQAITPAAVLTAVASFLLLLLARNLEKQRAEREEARQRALVAQKLEAMGQMTASVAHDFRNILTVMQATLRLIRRRGAEPAILAEADGTVERGNAMVDRLLAFSRRTDLRPEPHDANDLLRHLEGTLRHIAGADMKLVLDLADDLPPCQIDRIQFDAALMNLVVNARQAMAAGGVITVRSRSTAAAGASVEVADTGCGIDEATLKRVFEPFFTTKRETGTGLGLAQVQAFVEQIGGAVKVDSVVGMGTTVTLQLPRAAVRSKAATAASPILTLDPV